MMSSKINSVTIKGVTQAIVASVLPASNFSNIIRILFLGALFALFFLFTANFTLPGGASHFTDYSNALASGSHLGIAIAQRDVGFPLLLLLSGYSYHYSFVPIALMQALMAILMPLLVYLTVRPVFPNLAYYAGLALILTLSPFYYMKWIHHDQCNIFFSILSVYLLVIYITSKKPVYLYALTFAVIASSLARPASNLLYPLVIFLAYFYVRGSLWKYFFSVMIFVIVLITYSHHRYEIFDMKNLKSTPSYTGKQIFYNLYINSKEYGILLSPKLGPGMEMITENFYRNILPSPKESALLKAVEEEYFLQHYYYPYSALEMKEQIYKLPNWEYFALMSDDNLPDKTFLQASYEIVTRYPWYPIAYTARNMWVFLYDPGYLHSRYNVNPFGKEGIQDAFTIDRGDSKQYANFSERGIHEIAFDAFGQQSHLLKTIFRTIKHEFLVNYLFVNVLMFYFLSLVWFATLIGLFNHFISNRYLKLMADLFTPKQIIAPVIAISLVLLQSMLITCMFAEPDYRYHNFIIPLKVILAFYGLGVFIYFIRQSFSRLSIQNFTGNSNYLTMNVAQHENKLRIGLIFAIFLVLGGLYWWQFMFINT